MSSAPASPTFADPGARTASALDGVTALPGLGVIRALGEQAAQFLQGQLTQDVVLMPVGSSRLAAFCKKLDKLPVPVAGPRAGSKRASNNSTSSRASSG